MSVLVKSVDAAFSDGIVTVGALPNVPVAVTTLFEATVGAVADADGEPDAEAELDAGFELEEDGEDEQPAMATEAIAGIARSAAARRIETSRVRQAVTMRGWP
jgi:hypothetical protein